MSIKSIIPHEEIAEFCRKYRIRKLSLFGSVIRDDFSSLSDIDVLIEFLPDVEVGLEFFSMEAELSEKFGRKVDLNTLGFLSPYFRNEVIEASETIYEQA